MTKEHLAWIRSDSLVEYPDREMLNIATLAYSHARQWTHVVDILFHTPNKRAEDVIYSARRLFDHGNHTHRYGYLHGSICPRRIFSSNSKSQLFGSSRRNRILGPEIFKILIGG